MLSSDLAFKRITLVALFKKGCEVWELKREGDLEVLSNWGRGSGLDQFNKREGDEKWLQEKNTQGRVESKDSHMG